MIQWIKCIQNTNWALDHQPACRRLSAPCLCPQGKQHSRIDSRVCLADPTAPQHSSTCNTTLHSIQLTSVDSFLGLSGLYMFSVLLYRSILSVPSSRPSNSHTYGSSRIVTKNFCRFYAKQHYVSRSSSILWPLVLSDLGSLAASHTAPAVHPCSSSCAIICNETHFKGLIEKSNCSVIIEFWKCWIYQIHYLVFQKDFNSTVFLDLFHQVICMKFVRYIWLDKCFGPLTKHLINLRITKTTYTYFSLYLSLCLLLCFFSWVGCLGLGSQYWYCMFSLSARLALLPFKIVIVIVVFTILALSEKTCIYTQRLLNNIRCEVSAISVSYSRTG